MSEHSAFVQPKQWLADGTAAHHVLRLIANGQITADKGRELLIALLQGRIAKGDLPAFEAGGPIIPDLGNTEKFLRQP